MSWWKDKREHASDCSCDDCLDGQDIGPLASCARPQHQRNMWHALDCPQRQLDAPLSAKCTCGTTYGVKYKEPRR